MAYPSAADEHRIGPVGEPATDDAPFAADAETRPVRAPRRGGAAWLVWIVLALVAASGLGYYLWQQQQARQAGATPPAPPAQTAPPAAAAPQGVEHPIEEAKASVPPAVEQKPLPALMVSDTTMQNTLADLFGQAALGRMFYEDSIVHRFVSTVDNLPRKTLPLRYLPLKPPGGTFAASGNDEAMAIAGDNAARYAPYVQLAEAVDAKTLVGIYVHFYPLLQEDYRALGYPNGYFNDRLVQTIDDLLSAPEVSAPPALVQPKVFYQYADPDLESRSAGQKIMMRMGPDNAARIKAKLREIRALVTGSGVVAVKKK
jgi:hypothetical protein